MAKMKGRTCRPRRWAFSGAPPGGRFGVDQLAGVGPATSSQQPAATRVQRIVSHSLAAQLLRSAKRSCRFGLGYRGEACTSDSLKVWRSWLLHAVPAVVAWPMGYCCGAGAGACLTGSRGAGGGERAAGWGSKRRRRRGRRGAGQAGRRAGRQARVVATRWPVACRAVSGGLLYLLW